MTSKELGNKLKAPFSASGIEWRIQKYGYYPTPKSNDNVGWALVVPYVTNRAIMDRLDDVVGPFNWRNEFTKGPEGGVLCGISIKNGDEWITKYDGAENTAIESVKGGLSDAMKRSAVQWGIGRYLYELDSQFVQLSKDKNYGEHRNFDTKTKQTTYWRAPVLPEHALPKAE